RAYAGVPDTDGHVDPLASAVRGLAVDGGWPERTRRVLRFLGSARQTRARIVPEGGNGRPGFGFEVRRIAADDFAALKAARARGATVNDLLLAALHLSIDHWNTSHGARCGRVAIMMPVNLRPRERWYEVVGNLSSFVTVTTVPDERRTPADAVAAVAARTKRLKRSGAAL